MSAKALLSASVSAPPAVYVEDVFSTYLYTGNGSTQTITNGIDLSGKGGLVWTKSRTAAFLDHELTDTVRGAGLRLISNNTNAQGGAGSSDTTSFTTTGFGLTYNNGNGNLNGQNYASWTFRKQPKFFDVVTYTGNGVAGRQIAHNLGSTPGFVVVKNITSANSWFCWHTAIPGSGGFLETTDAFSPGYKYICNTVNSTVFSVDSGGASVNGSGSNYVAYLFAHNAGGFGDAGTDNVVSCGTFTTNGTGNATVSLGWEPQWVLVKNTGAVEDWFLVDNMRGWVVGGNSQYLRPNVANAESGTALGNPTATGFTYSLSASTSYIYIAIRRGPMKVPTVGTSVFSPIAASSGTQTTNFPVDMQILSYRTGTDAFLNHQVIDRLRGVSSTSTPQGNYLNTTSTAAESNVDPYSSINMSNIGFDVPNNYAGASGVFHSFRRAPGFFDVVCYTGDGTAGRAITHNLGVTPEWMIVKRRSNNDGAGFWASYSATTGNTQSTQFGTVAAALTNSTFWNNTSPTSTNFTVGTITRVNGSGETYVAYLFATCPGVSKCGSYTGNGTTQTINCDFTGGARFVLIKRTDSTGNWYVYDTARGMTVLTDPYLLLNTTAAEVATLGSVTTVSTGFALNSAILADINISAGSYIFLAIA